MSFPLAPVVAKHLQNAHNYRGTGRQFIEGPNNANPWGLAQGIANAAYCNSAADMVPYQEVGYRHWPESQFGEKGCAYTVFSVQIGDRHGEVMFDRPGAPCDILAGDELFYDWSGGKGSAGIVDHVETAVEDIGAGPKSHNAGYNTGSPGGCYDLWRDRRYLVCRRRFSRNGGYQRGAAPLPAPALGLWPFTEE